MKYLEYTPLDRINEFLSHVNLGERTIKACLEAYSCKHTGTDKKLSLSLESEDPIMYEDKSKRLLNIIKTDYIIQQLSCQVVGKRRKRFSDMMRVSVVFEMANFEPTFLDFWSPILDCLGKSSDSDSSSSVEYLHTSSRRTLIYLLLTLHHMYPDYDFSAVKAHQFFHEESWDSFKQIFDIYMFEASKEWLEVNEGSSLLDTFYKALDEVVKLEECEIYSYNAEADADPFLENGAIWSYHFFFYNRKLKRVVSFRFSCISNLAAESFSMDEPSYNNEGDEDIFDGMDI